MWIGVIHHVCGEHEWENGECSHGQLTEVEEGKELSAKDSKAAGELRKIVFDAEWLKSLQHYVRFRYVLPVWMQKTQHTNVPIYCYELCLKIDVQLSDHKNEIGIIKAYHVIP